VVQAESGLMSLNGFPDGEPHKTAIAMIDITTGMFAAHAILAALYARVASGRGQFIDVPLFDNAASLGSYQTMNYLVSGVNPQRLGNNSPIVAPVDLFTAQDGKFFMTIGGDSVWNKLVKALGDPPELQSADYATNNARLKNEAKLKPVLETMFGQASLAEWMERLRAAGVPAGPVRSIAEAVDSPEMKERGIIGTAPHTGAGTVPNLRLPMAMSGTPLIAPRGAPVLGEHTHSVLAELLNYQPDRIADLEKKGVIPRKRSG
jgi:crotonobetainyl-CoA:carnitine CoA-transferase CaiB-like acyl-CoA transferase